MPIDAINGARLYWELTGTVGDLLVLVHGSWSDHHGWDAVVPGLSRSFRVLTYDRRGHSQNDRPTGQGSVHEDVADLAALIEHTGLGPAHIAGSSFGAAITLRLAGQRPDLFRSLIAHEPPVFSLLADSPDMQPAMTEAAKRVQAVLERLRSGETAEGTRLFMETIALGPGAWPQLPERARKTFIFNAPTFVDENQDPESQALPLAPLRDFPHRALLTRGDQSAPFFPPVLDKIAAALRKVERRIFHGAGHVPHLTHPDAYVEVVKEFAGRSGQALR